MKRLKIKKDKSSKPEKLQLKILRPKEVKVSKREASRKAKQRPRGAVLLKPAPLKKKIDWKGLFLARQTQLTFALSVSFVVLVTLMVAVNQIKAIKNTYAIERVLVKGDFDQINKDKVEAELSSLVGTNYFDLDLKAIHQRMSEFVWIETVEVKRQWPDSVVISLQEHLVVAQWGKTGVITGLAEVLYPETLKLASLKHLPTLDGGENDGEKVLTTYLSMKDEIGNRNLQIKELELVSNVFWKFKFNNGLELLLNLEQDKASFSDFLNMYENNAVAKMDHVQKIDMRYHNGFSIVFKPGSKEMHEKKYGVLEPIIIKTQYKKPSESKRHG